VEARSAWIPKREDLLAGAPSDIKLPPLWGVKNKTTEWRTAGAFAGHLLRASTRVHGKRARGSYRRRNSGGGGGGSGGRPARRGVLSFRNGRFEFDDELSEEAAAATIAAAAALPLGAPAVTATSLEATMQARH
jgi:hypothetical protein